MARDPVEQYLARYAAPEVRLAETVREPVRGVVVVPAFDEDPGFVDHLAPALGDALCIVVVNAPLDAPPAARQRTAALAEQLRRRDDLPLLVIDRATPGRELAARQGVGTARRIGCDVALALARRGLVPGGDAAWIHTTDADVTLPTGYLAATEGVADEVVALTYPFRHHPDPPTLASAVAQYDASLRYYVAGLRWAGSPYAFHTIGSTIAVRARAYAAVRGVPARRGGEDFYLLDKLAKLGPIHEPACAPLVVAGRPSARVPFGTGPSLARLAAGGQLEVYHPRCFADLRDVLAGLEAFVAGGPVPALFTSDEARTLASFPARTRSAGVLARRVRDWFDGFRTLKLIHRVRDARHGTLPLAEALADDARPAVAAGAWWRNAALAALG